MNGERLAANAQRLTARSWQLTADDSALTAHNSQRQGVSALMVAVIGIGNDFRGDDAVGLVVARSVRERAPHSVTVHESHGDGTALLDLWAGAGRVIVVDAMRSGCSPGTVVRFDGLDEGHWPNGSRGALASSHALGVLEAIELGRILGLLPASLVVYGVEGASFDMGAPLSPQVAATVPAIVDQIVAEVAG